MTQFAMRAAPISIKQHRMVAFRPGSPGTALFASSWFLVTALGLMPLVEMKLHRSPSLPALTVVAFFIAAGSAATLRRRYTWLGVVLHIYSQIAIWLSLTFCSMAFVMSVTAR